MARLEGAFEQVNERLGRIEHTFDARFAQVDQRFAQVDQRFAQIDQKFMWLIATVVGTWITTMIALLIHH